MIRYSIRVNHGDADITVKYYDIAQNARAFRHITAATQLLSYIMVALQPLSCVMNAPFG